MSKYLQVIGPLKGEDGKSAYQYAQDGGYTGTETEFAEKLAAEIPKAYTLPVASETTLGGVQPAAKTETMTQAVGVDADGALWTEAGSGGGSRRTLTLIAELTLSEEAHFEITNDIDGNPISETELIITSFIPAASENRDVNMKIKGEDGTWTLASGTAFKTKTADYYHNDHIIATGDYLLIETNYGESAVYNANLNSYRKMTAHTGPICGVGSFYHLPTAGSIIKLYAWR